MRQFDGGGAEWCLVRPTTVWGPGMGEHYRRFFKLLQDGRYFHVGGKPLKKSYGYIENVVHQFKALLHAPTEAVHRKTFYFADYEPLSLRAWIDSLAQELEAPRVRQLPEMVMKIGATVGDCLNSFGIKSFPFNSFRLNNILTEYVFDLSATKRICGPLPVTWEEGVREMARWFKNLNSMP